MDDLRTQETLDALADLFLTGTTPPVRKPPGTPMRTPPRKSFEDDAPSAVALEPKVMMNNDSLTPRPGAGTSAPAHSSIHDSLAHELEGPGPISIGARSTSAAHYAEHADDDASYHHEPSHLKLHDENESDDPAPQAAHVEAVILGNLPGFGGPWLTQYAYHLAQQRGPVGILHLTRDHADLELVTAQRQNVRAGLDEPLPPGSTIDALIARMSRMAADRSQPVATWLVHLPSVNDAAQVAKAAALSHWTILCGGDDMAVAGAARMLQSMQQAAAQTRDIARIIGVMIMGSDEAKAREAINKFNAAASSFLRQPVELLGSRRQMTPVHMRPLGGATGEQVWPAIESFLAALPVGDEPSAAPQRADAQAAPDSDTPEPEHQPFTPPAPAVLPTSAAFMPAASMKEPTMPSALIEPADEVDHLLHEADAARSHAAAVASPRPAAAERTASIASPSTSPRSPQPQRYVHTQESQEPSPFRDGAAFVAGRDPKTSAPRPIGAQVSEPAPSSINEPDLVALLTGSLAGSVALEARYPKQSDTQLILDQDGRLHLLRRQLGADLKAALVDLIEARDWVVEHRSLIALTQRQCRFDLDAQPTLHLFTSDAKNAVAMVNKLGPFVKLHLLQEVRIGHARTWICTELN